MTVQTTALRGDYTGNGVTVAFAVPFYFLENSHVQIEKLDTLTNVTTTLALTTDYTLAGAGVLTGGTATLLAAPLSTDRIAITRNVPYTQQTHYVEGDPFPSQSHEAALDKLTMLAQQLDEESSRSLKVPSSAAGFDGEIPAMLPSRLVGTNAAGTGFELVAPSSGSAAELALDLATSIGSTLIGFIQAGAGAVLRTVQSKLRDTVSVKDYGAVGDGITDDGPAIQAAIDAAGANPALAVEFPGTNQSYYIASGLVLDNAKASLKAKGVVVISTDQSINMLTVTGAASILDGLQFYRTGGTGKGVVLNVPECKLYNLRISGGHSIGLEMSGAYLTSMIKCYISGNGVNVKDLGTSQASEMVGCNLYGGAGTSTNLVWESAGLTVLGGAIEFSNSWEVLVGITNDASRAQFVGVHFESTPTTTNPMIVAGKATAGNSQIILRGCEFFGNSATRTAIQLRGVSACESGGHYFSAFNAASTLYDITAVAKNILLTTSNNTTAATYKTVNASVTGLVEFETESTSYNSVSLTHGAGGGVLGGVQDIKSSPRGAALTITSKRNSAGNAMDFKTPGADNATLFSRMQMTSGADVGKVTFPSATVEVAGSYTAPFKIGTAYFWINAGKLYLKDGSVPTTATDGTIVGTQT